MKRVLVVVLVVALAGCAYRPVIDPAAGRSMENYAKDLAECQALAQANDSSGANAAGGAVIGAAIVGGIAAILGGSGAGRWAASGAVAGGAEGLAAGQREQRAIVRNCLLGRGYRVLN